MLLFKQDLHEQAISFYKKCLQVNPEHADCLCGMGNAHVKIGRYTKLLHVSAGSMLHTAPAQHPQSVAHVIFDV